MGKNPQGYEIHSRLSALELDAVSLLRNQKRTAVAMRDRLDARYYLMNFCGFTAREVNDLRDNKETS